MESDWSGEHRVLAERPSPPCIASGSSDRTQAQLLSGKEIEDQTTLVNALLSRNYAKLRLLLDRLRNNIVLNTKCWCLRRICNNCACSRVFEGLVPSDVIFKLLSATNCGVIHELRGFDGLAMKVLGSWIHAYLSQERVNRVTSHRAANDSVVRSSITPLHLAVILGDTKLAGWIISQVDQSEEDYCRLCIDDNGESRHVECERNGDTLGANADASDTDAHQNQNKAWDHQLTGVFELNALQIAIVRQDRAMVTLLLERGADVRRKAVSLGGIGLCMLAVLSRNRRSSSSADVLSTLIKYGASVNCENGGLTPLSIAVCEADSPVVRELVKAGAKQDRHSNGDLSLLYQAVHYDEAFFDIAMALLESPCACVNERSDNGTLPLFNAIFHSPHYQAYHAKEIVAYVRRLLELGADPEADLNALPYVHMAIELNFVEIVKLLIEFGVNMERPNHGGYSPLHMAAWEGQVEICRLLIQSASSLNSVAGFETDQRSPDRNTPLSLACHGDQTEVVMLLLERPCNVNNADKDDDTPLLYATWRGNLEITQALLEKGACVNQANQANTTPIWYAAYHNNLRLVKFLLSHNPRVDVASHGTHQMAGALVYLHDSPVTPIEVVFSSFESRESVTEGITRMYLAIIRLLLLSGAHIPAHAHTSQLCSHLASLLSRPLPLLCLVRIFIRRWLVGKRLLVASSHLEIPVTLKNFLRFIEDIE